MALPTLSADAQRTYDGLREALPSREFAAVDAWLHTFYRFQLEWILDWSRFMLALKSRQIGISHTIAGAAVLWGLFGETTTVISLGQREADEVLAKSKLHASALAELGSRWAVPLHNSATKLIMRGNGRGDGGRILSLPNTSAGRSFSGNVILDELAYYDRPYEVWDGAAGTALHGYRIRGLSTPNGAAGLFYELWSDPKQNEGYSRHAVTLDDAIADGMPVDIADCWRLARGDERVFNQLFCCSFLDNEQQYIPTHLVEAARIDSTYIPHGPCWAGLDIGKEVDRTELAIVRRNHDGRYHVVHTATCKRTQLGDIQMLVARAFAPPFGVERMCIDATGLGAFPASEAQAAYGEMSVEPVSFTLQSKEDMATRAHSLFASDMIRMPRDNEQLFRDVCSIKRVVTQAGNVSYEAPRTSEGHADSFWALAMALRAANAPIATKTVIADM